MREATPLGRFIRGAGVRASEQQVRACVGRLQRYFTIGKLEWPRWMRLPSFTVRRRPAKRSLRFWRHWEIAQYLSHAFDNAVVAVEDPSWIVDTMQNGQWNHGALIQWLTHYVSQNGGWVVAVNPANTSQQLPYVRVQVTTLRKLSVCPSVGRWIEALMLRRILPHARYRMVKAKVKNRKLATSTAQETLAAARTR